VSVALTYVRIFLELERVDIALCARFQRIAYNIVAIPPAKDVRIRSRAAAQVIVAGAPSRMSLPVPPTKLSLPPRPSSRSLPPRHPGRH